MGKLLFNKPGGSPASLFSATRKKKRVKPRWVGASTPQANSPHYFCSWVVVGLLIIGLFAIPQTFLIGFLRGAVHKYTRRIPTFLRLSVDVSFAILIFYFLSWLWNGCFWHVMPLVFVIVAILASRILVNKDDLVGAAPANQMALTLGGVAFIIIELFKGGHLWLP